MNDLMSELDRVGIPYLWVDSVAVHRDDDLLRKFAESATIHVCLGHFTWFLLTIKRSICCCSHVYYDRRGDYPIVQPRNLALLNWQCVGLATRMG